MRFLEREKVETREKYFFFFFSSNWPIFYFIFEIVLSERFSRESDFELNFA